MNLTDLLKYIHQSSETNNDVTKLRGRVKLPDENRLVELKIIGASSADKFGHVYIDMETIPETE